MAKCSSLLVTTDNYSKMMRSLETNSGLLEVMKSLVGKKWDAIGMGYMA